MKNTTTAHRANRTRKDPQIIDGCRRLFARRTGAGVQPLFHRQPPGHPLVARFRQQNALLGE